MVAFMNNVLPPEKLLQWFVTAGADESVGDEPVNRFAPPEAPPVAAARSGGGGPKFRKFGTMRVIYKVEDLDEWIERRLSKIFSSTGIPCDGDDK